MVLVHRRARGVESAQGSMHAAWVRVLAVSWVLTVRCYLTTPLRHRRVVCCVATPARV